MSLVIRFYSLYTKICVKVWHTFVYMYNYRILLYTCIIIEKSGHLLEGLFQSFGFESYNTLSF